eukprot:gnl/Hemi2/26456_TR8882_c0_g1_i1.p1 gnl/Hemi2/26456_TR8882_c0_g1~~gnl/Hemi2/26456_TR8882_c0_g1_i1.p1  ORF type:complete len:327 (+),score=112.72 gnl/Hemi2/26456_TR8882_c0_g1_i1:112-1092(+)
MQSERLRLYCKICKQNDPDVDQDSSNGDVVCRGCGLVLEDKLIDEHSEWRTFSNDTSSRDPSRVGGPRNPLLEDAGLSTIIATKPGTTDTTAAALSKWQNRGALKSSDRNLIQAFKEIARIAERMGIPQTIVDRSNELYKQIEEQKSMRGRSINNIIAACIYTACRQVGVPRTLKEVCAVTQVDKKEIGRCFKFMLRTLDINLETINSGDFMIRFCSNLDLPVPIQRAAQHVSKMALEMGVVAGKSPISVAAASIFLVCQMSKHKDKTPAEISGVTGMSEATIRGTYKDLLPHRTALLPPDFAPFTASSTAPSPLGDGHEHSAIVL